MAEKQVVSDQPKPEVAMVDRSAIKGWNLDRVTPKLSRLMENQAGFKPGTILYKKDQGPKVFVASNPHETINFPTDHPMAGHCQWIWKDSEMVGVQLGTRIVYKPNATGFNLDLTDES